MSCPKTVKSLTQWIAGFGPVNINVSASNMKKKIKSILSTVMKDPKGGFTFI